MFKAIGRWFRAFGYMLTGQIDAARKVLDENPHVIKAKFDEIIETKTTRIQQYKQAVASLIAQQEKKITRIKQLTEDVEKLENLKLGAGAQAKNIVAKLQSEGKTMDQIKQNETYSKCLTAFNDFSSTLLEKQGRINDLEEDIAEYTKKISEHKVQVQALVRDVDKLREEAAETVADIITSKEERDVADMISGISQDDTAQELSSLRDMRQQMKAEARISSELAGTETKSQEAEFLKFAEESVANSEFEALVGLAASKDIVNVASSVDAQTEKLPE